MTLQLSPAAHAAYSGEGWDDHDAAHIILSDGSATLRFLDPQTFK